MLSLYFYVYRMISCVIWTTIQNILIRAQASWQALLKTSSLKFVFFEIFKTCSLFAIASEKNVLIAGGGWVGGLISVTLNWTLVTATIFVLLGRCIWLGQLSSVSLLKLRCQSSYGVVEGICWQACMPIKFLLREGSVKLAFDFEKYCTFSGVHFCHCSLS